MDKKHLTPAEVVVSVFGPTKAKAARALQIDRQVIEYWLKPRKNTDAGVIPSRRHKEFLIKAQKLNIDLTPSDLIFGREVSL